MSKQPGKDEWNHIKNELSFPYRCVYLRCDSYLVKAVVTPSKMRLFIQVYVNGWIKGKDVFIGYESLNRSPSDIAQRFYCRSKKAVPAKERAFYEKTMGKRGYKKSQLAEPLLILRPTFTSPTAFVAHIKKHNESIIILSEEEYEEQLSQHQANEETPAVN